MKRAVKNEIKKMALEHWYCPYKRSTLIHWADVGDAMYYHKLMKKMKDDGKKCCPFNDLIDEHIHQQEKRKC